MTQVLEPTLSQRLTLRLKPEFLPSLFPILQRGFIIQGVTGRSIREALLHQLGLTSEIIEDRVQTVFLNGKAVDNLDESIVTHGSTVALSAAMPGLVGATFRRGGTYASFRSQVTYQGHEEAARHAEGFFILKLFNLLLDELGPALLERGVWIAKDHLQEWLKSQDEGFPSKCRAADLDGSDVPPERLREVVWREDSVFLRVLLD